MNSFRLCRGGLKAAVGALAIVVLVGGCGSSGSPEAAPATTQPAVTATVVPTVTVTPTVTVEATVKPTQSVSRPVRPATVPTKKATPSATRTSTKPTVRRPTATKSSSSVYYENCTAVRAAGAAPIHRGEPGYSSKLDRDGDGVACEN
jgi:hypothetical protein